MVSPSREVVITGMGVVCPIGIGREAFEQSLENRQTGISDFGERFGTLPIAYGSAVQDFNPKEYVKPRKSIKLMCREIQTGYAAAALGVEDAGLDVKQVDSDRFGVVMGSEMLYGDPEELTSVIRNSTVDGTTNLKRFGDRILHDMFPLWMLNYLPNMAACHIGIGVQAFGANNTIVQGDASSLLAIAEAASVIQRGWCDVMIAGGCGTRINLTHRAHTGGEPFSTGKLPETASRPFDTNRNGQVFGEGAGALVLESAEHAEKRDAKPLARIAGWGSTHTGQPTDYQGADTACIRRSIEVALQHSGISAADLDHVNAHGLSDTRRDRYEAVAINAALGDVPVTGIKSFFGNLGAGSGTIEVAASLASAAKGYVCGTLNHEETDPECPIHVIGADGKAVAKKFFLAMNQSTTGQAAAMVFERY